MQLPPSCVGRRDLAAISDQRSKPIDIAMADTTPRALHAKRRLRPIRGNPGVLRLALP
jgi:hypothetical protein